MGQEEHGYRINWKNKFLKYGAYGYFRVAGHIYIISTNAMFLHKYLTLIIILEADK